MPPQKRASHPTRVALAKMAEYPAYHGLSAPAAYEMGNLLMPRSNPTTVRNSTAFILSTAHK